MLEMIKADKNLSVISTYSKEKTNQEKAMEINQMIRENY